MLKYQTTFELVMIIPSPVLSYYGLPALPIICKISYGDNSTHLPFSGLYICVPLMITVWAGKFTPHAKVAVEIRSCKCLSANRSSTSVLSFQLRPAWWMPTPN